MDRHNPLPNNTSSDIIRNQSLSFRNGVFQPVREENLQLRDVTINDVSTTKHGLTPKLPSDATKFLDGTGAYSVPPGSVTAADIVLGKAFFSHNSLMPATTYKEELYDMPAADFSNLNSGSIARNMSVGKFTPSGTPANWGWDTGALRTKMLVIFGMIRPRSLGMGVFISDTLPSASDIPDKSYMYDMEGTPQTVLYKHTGGTFTALVTDNTVGMNGSQNYDPSWGIALYYDDSANRLVCFLRHGYGEWFPVIDTTDSSLTTVRYAGLRISQSGNPKFYYGCPMAIYYTT